MSGREPASRKGRPSLVRPQADAAPQTRLESSSDREMTKARTHRLPGIEFWLSLGVEDVGPVEVFLLLVQIQQLINDEIERGLKVLDLGLTRFLALVAITDRDGGMRLGDLSARIHVHPTTVTVLVDQLVRDGLVRRERQATDRRARLAVATPAGRTLARLAAEELVKANFGLPRLDPMKRERLLELLLDLRTAATSR